MATSYLRHPKVIRLVLSVLFLSLFVLVDRLAFFPQATAHASVSGFVTRSGSTLELNGNAYRFSGANMEFFGASYLSNAQDDALIAQAKEMGANVIRSQSLGITTGYSWNIEPSLDTYNAYAFNQLDYALKIAGDNGMRVIIPLTDNYHYSYGGKHFFTDWCGTTEDQFFTNSCAINAFERAINQFLNHVNTYTGIAYKNDPTILMWETANEVSPPTSWTQTIASYIKSIDANHLVLDGNLGVSTADLSISSVDVVSNHYYGNSLGNVSSDASTATNGGKAFCACEYDWNNSSTDTFLSTDLSDTNVSGDLFWEIMAPDGNYGYLRNYPPLDFEYPGTNSTMLSRSAELRNHIYAMQGLSVPADGLPGQPVITSVNGNAISWSVGVLGDMYTIERSSDDQNWTTICNQCVNDAGSPWTDTAQPAGTLYYRITAYNRSGSAGPTSPVYQYVPATAANLPGGWSQTDIGGPAAAGSASYSNQVFTVSGAGSDIYNAADQFHFVYQALSGDGTIIAHVASVADTDSWAKAGVMIRESLNPGATDAFMYLTPGNNDNFITRTSTNANATNTERSNATTLLSRTPYWVKLTRSGSTFTGYSSTDGLTWTQVGSTVISMASNVYIGLAVTSHSSNVVNSAVFDQVCVSCTEGVASPWQTGSVGGIFHYLGDSDPGVIEGGARVSNGDYTVWAASTDIYNNADSFNWVYQPLDGDGTIIARVTGIANTDPWAKAGVMIRESLNSDATNAYMYLTPGNGLNFIARTSTGANSVNTHGPATTTAPYWLKLVRSGNTFTGYASSDGLNWGAAIGSATIDMNSVAYVGLAVTSHNPALVNTATFDNVSLTASNASVETDDPSASYTGSWNSSNTVNGYYNETAHWSDSVGSSVSFTFTGTGIAWVGGANDAHGQANVYIDGVLDTPNVDTYATAFNTQQVLYSKSGLSSGQHTIKIVVTGTQESASSGATVDVDAFIVTP